MTSEQTQPVSMYPELDEATLVQIIRALETGDTSRLAPSRVVEVEQARAQVEFSRVKVPGAEGVELDGALWRHPDGGPRAVIVMPSPWVDLGWAVYVAQATLFALKGYNVLAYTARGFGDSGGEVEVAGPLDVADASLALNFLTARTEGEVRGVGFLGDSYGSGISQLVAAHDDRVNAVVALSTWGDLGEAFFENSTRHVAAVQTLLGAASKARLSARTRQAFEDVLANRNVQDTLAWALPRSPYTHVERLNGNPVSILFANAWHETLFPTNQMLKVFNALTRPKRLLMSIGDHSGPESPGIVGLPNRIWADAHRWLDHHLLGDDNGIDAEDQVVCQVMWDGGLESRPTWDTIGERIDRLYLVGAQNGGGAVLADKPGGDWELTFRAGTDTPATVANKIIMSGYAEMAGLPKIYRTGQIDRSDAGAWVTAPMPDGRRLRGVPRLRLTYTPGAADSTLVAHLFDVDVFGLARIITHAPFTHLGGEAGRPVTVDIELQATGYDIKDKHRLMLVLDTKDPFYGDATEAGTTITVSSSDDDPSYLEIPVR
ncbi:alpha/beta fold hydrolase [Embleya sp. NBC_00896]|uniref:alpha/beta fold hydrolase n=1 Tax=Embleya sp. NBC_00896 TaxID=2975961 RepID=UPI0038695EDF|nr:alpha/beta hydrolase [Embleya sp. NBC_00896]